MGDVSRRGTNARAAARFDHYVTLYGRKVERILSANRCGSPCDPFTWERVGVFRGHDWEWTYDPEEGPGAFVSCEPETGCIRINTAYPVHVQVRACIHELSHAELNRLYLRLPISLFMGYGFSSEDLQQAICKRVEYLILGELPDFMTNLHKERTASPQSFEDFAAAFGLASGELPPAHRELLSLYRQQTELWQSQVELAQSQVELAQSQTEIFRGMVESILTGRQAESGEEEADQP